MQSRRIIHRGRLVTIARSLHRTVATVASLTMLTAAVALAQAAPANIARPGATNPVDGYIREALRANLALAQDQLDEDRADVAVREARALRLPSVSFSSRRTQVDGGLDLGDLINPAYRTLNQLTGSNAFPTNFGLTLPFAQETRVRIAQPVYQPAIGAGVRAASAAREARSASVRAAERRLAAEVQTSYWGVASTMHVAELYRATLPLVEENVRVNERLLANGTVTPEAVLRARAERSEVVQQLADAENQHASAIRAFNLLLDRPFDTPVELPADSTLESIARVTESLTLDELIRHALGARDELRQADFAIAAATFQEKVATAAFLPTIAVALDYGVQGNSYQFDRDHDALAASVVVEWNLFSGGRDEARRQQASISANHARVARREAERRIELDVRQAYDALQVARSAIGTAQDRVAAARRSFELVTRRHAEGMASQIEFIDARTAYTRAALNLILTRQSYAVRAAELERAAALRTLG
jgi:outer membrane protein TolC